MSKKGSRKNKEEKVYFCKMCGFTAVDLDELDFHYKMEHEDFDEDSFW